MERYSRVFPSTGQVRYSEEFKRFVCNDFITGTLTLKQIEHKYKLGNSRVTCWLKELGYNYIPPTPLYLPIMPKPSKPEKGQDKTVEQLKIELEDARLQAEAYRRMIDKAEQELKINIRKKSNTK